MFTRLVLFAAAAGFCAPLYAAETGSSNVGKRYPSEMRTMPDAVTGRTLHVLTTSSFSESKPYQTHPTWTADGKWIVFRSERGGNGSQVFLINETSGDIIQVTDEARANAGGINLSRKEMKAWLMRGGPRLWRGSNTGDAAGAPDMPRQLVEINLGALINDSMAGTVKAPATYERVVATLPNEIRDSGGIAIDADESKAYWGVSPGARNTPAPTPAPAATAGAKSEFERAQLGSRASLDNKNMDPTESREAARARFAEAGKGPGGIRSIDLKTGELKTVIDTDFRMGHVQTNPWKAGEIIYCHETGGDAPQRMWAVNGDGSNNRPIYVESPDEWITHETVSGPDEVMFLIIGHLPYLREKPTGIAVVNLRDKQMKILGQLEEDMGQGQKGGYWHCNGSPDGRWAVGDTFKGSIYVIDRHTGENILLTTGHVMKPDHTHPIFSPDGKRILIQSGLLSGGKNLNLMTVDVPQPRS